MIQLFPLYAVVWASKYTKFRLLTSNAGLQLDLNCKNISPTICKQIYSNAKVMIWLFGLDCPLGHLWNRDLFLGFRPSTEKTGPLMDHFVVHLCVQTLFLRNG